MVKLGLAVRENSTLVETPVRSINSNGDGLLSKSNLQVRDASLSNIGV